LLGLDVIGQEQDGDWSYFGYDGLGSVRTMTDSTGNPVYTADYSPYGEPLAQQGDATTNLGFTGEYTDSSGLLYLRARYANLSTASFMTTDPVSGVVGQQSVRWNPYLYVGGNPVNWVDPSGEFFPLVPIAIIAAGAVAGGLIDYAIQRASGVSHECVNTNSILESALLGGLGAAVAVATGGAGLGPIARFAIEVGVDTVASTVLALAVRGGEFGPAFKRNLVASLVGSGVGEGLSFIGRRFGKSIVRRLSGGFDRVWRKLAYRDINIVGFRGAGKAERWSDEVMDIVTRNLDKNQRGLIGVGHVGVSFDNNRTIHGFWPTGEEISTLGFKGRLDAGDPVPGRWYDDTAIFRTAREVSQIEPRSIVRQSTVSVPIWEHRQIRRNTMDRMSNYQNYHDLYRLSEKNVPMPTSCNNCATRANRLLGNPLSEDTGQMKDFINYLPDLWP
jgi:RHS repeat-associated protein